MVGAAKKTGGAFTHATDGSYKTEVVWDSTEVIHLPNHNGTRTCFDPNAVLTPLVIMAEHPKMAMAIAAHSLPELDKAIVDAEASGDGALLSVLGLMKQDLQFAAEGRWTPTFYGRA